MDQQGRGRALQALADWRDQPVDPMDLEGDSSRFYPASACLVCGPIVACDAAAGLPMPKPPDPPSPAELDDLLRPLATQLIWWQPADVSLRNPDRVIAQVLDLGTFEAGQRLRQVLGDRRLAQVLQRAEAGWFSPRSWNYWQQKLGLARSGAVPPLPRRHFRVRDGGDHAAA